MRQFEFSPLVFPHAPFSAFHLSLLDVPLYILLPPSKVRNSPKSGVPLEYMFWGKLWYNTLGHTSAMKEHVDISPAKFKNTDQKKTDLPAFTMHPA